jgi:hypothetical protein
VAYTKAIPQLAYYEVLKSGHFTHTDQPLVIKSILKGLVSSSENEGKDNSHTEIRYQNTEISGVLNLQAE